MKRHAKRQPASDAQPKSAQPHAPGRGARIALLVVLTIGLLIRVITVFLAPQSAYLFDHINNMGWSSYAVEHGPWHIYELPEYQPVIVRTEDPRSGQTFESVRPNALACNYPPLSTYVFWVQGMLWHTFDHNVVTLPPPPRMAQLLKSAEPVSGRVIDTPASRFANAFPGIVFDFLLAWGLMHLIRTLRGGQRQPWLETIAFAIVALAPPIILDSAHWNQADSWISALLVWTLVWLMRERFVLAGLLYGAAIMTKPQAILFGPVFLYVFLALRYMPGGTWKRAFGLVKTGVVAVLTMAIIAAPFMIADAGSDANPDGAWRWFKRSYVGTIGAERYQRTTMSAYNLWHLDLIGQGIPKSGAERNAGWDATRTMLGVQKATLGKVLLGIGVLLAGVLCARKWRWEPQSWLAFAYLVTLAAFILPTGVHERYIYYCIPFAIALAVNRPAVWIAPLLLLLIVGTAEMLSFNWSGQIYRAGSTARGATTLAAVAMLLVLLYSFVVLIPRVSQRQTQKT